MLKLLCRLRNRDFRRLAPSHADLFEQQESMFSSQWAILDSFFFGGCIIFRIVHVFYFSPRGLTLGCTAAAARFHVHIRKCYV